MNGGESGGGEIVATFHEEPRKTGISGWSRKTWLVLIGVGIAVAVAVVLIVMLTGGGGGGIGGKY
jgi:hypothetical protein